MLKKTDTVPSLDRRQHRRYRPGAPVSVAVFVLPGLQPHAARVKDLSWGGVGLYFSGPALAPGARVLVRFPGPGRGTTHTALAEVVHSGVPEGDFHLVGCRFLSRLAPGQLHESLRPDGERVGGRSRPTLQVPVKALGHEDGPREFHQREVAAAGLLP